MHEWGPVPNKLLILKRKKNKNSFPCFFSNGKCFGFPLFQSAPFPVNADTQLAESCCTEQGCSSSHMAAECCSMAAEQAGILLTVMAPSGHSCAEQMKRKGTRIYCINTPSASLYRFHLHLVLFPSAGLQSPQHSRTSTSTAKDRDGRWHEGRGVRWSESEM